MDFTRQQVLFHRIHQHELDRRVSDVAELAVLSLGVQDNTSGSALLSLAARLHDPSVEVADELGEDLALYGDLAAGRDHAEDLGL